MESDSFVGYPANFIIPKAEKSSRNWEEAGIFEKMTSNHRNGCSHSFSTSRERKSWSFFKLMLQPAIQSKKLRIPEAFARNYGDELSTAVVLTVPTQESWKVALVQEGDALWFHDGWQEFVEYYSIGFAYFLIFEYVGNSEFEVHIFDTTACEISYLYNAHNSPRGQKGPCDDHQSEERCLQKKPHVDSGISVETSDVIKLESEDDSSLCKHDEQMHDDNVDDVISGFSDSSPASDDEERDQYEESEHSTDANGVKRGNQSGDLWLKHKEALASTGLAKPRNPFFITVIKKRHLQRTPFVYVPAHFAPYLRRQAGKSVKLEASDRGARWAVRYTAGGRRYNLGGGWIIFARDNNLKAGDVCVFELTDVNKYILKVHVAKKSRIRSGLRH